MIGLETLYLQEDGTTEIRGNMIHICKTNIKEILLIGKVIHHRQKYVY